MTSDQQMKKEIAYLTSLIASHKRNHQSNSYHGGGMPSHHPNHPNHTHHTRHSRNWKNSPQKSKFQKRTVPAKNQYSWKPKQSGHVNPAVLSRVAPSHAVPSRPAPSHVPLSHVLPSRATPSHVGPSHAVPTRAGQKHGLPATPQQATKRLKLNAEKIKSNSPTKYKWNNKSNNRKSPKSVLKHQGKPQVLSSTYSLHKHQVKRGKVGKNRTLQRTQQTRDVVVGQRVVGKYRMRRIMLGQLKSRITSPSRFNTSRNKYRVVKDKGALVGHNGRSRFTKVLSPSRLQYKHHRLHRVFITKQSASVATRYKLVKPTMQSTTSQTRSRKSGNIVLRRKQGEVLVVPVAKPSPHHYSVKHKLASQALQRSIQTIRSKNRNKVLRKFCIFYNRFGRCNRGDKCPHRHDPDRVALCTRFLRGTCRNESCPFSHKLIKEKMPVCSFYLHGRCTMKECPYLHVFVGHAAAVCKSFANDGYCAKADKCYEKHIRVCPEFYATGSCKVGGTCKLPHTQQIHRNSKKPSKKLPSQTCSVSEPPGFMGFRSIKEDVKIKQQEPSEPAETSELRIQPRLQKFRKPL